MLPARIMLKTSIAALIHTQISLSLRTVLQEQRQISGRLFRVSWELSQITREADFISQLRAMEAIMDQSSMST